MPTPTPRVSRSYSQSGFGLFAVVTFSLVIAATIVSYQRRLPQVQRINYSQLYSLAEAGGGVALLQIEGETVTLTKVRWVVG